MLQLSAASIRTIQPHCRRTVVIQQTIRGVGVIQRLATAVLGFGIWAFAGFASALPVLSAPSSIHFSSGTVQVGVIVTNVSDAVVTLTGATLSGGPVEFPARGYFTLGFPFLCNPDVVMPPGGTCTINYEYAQIAPGENSQQASITLGFNDGASFETMLVDLVVDPPSGIPTLSRWPLIFLAGLIAVVTVQSVGGKYRKPTLRG